MAESSEVPSNSGGVSGDQVKGGADAVPLVNLRHAFGEKSFDTADNLLVHVIQPRIRRFVIDFDAIWENRKLSDQLEGRAKTYDSSGRGLVIERQKPVLRVIRHSVPPVE